MRKPSEISLAAWAARQPWNAQISGAGRCLECRHRTVFDHVGAAVLFHDTACAAAKEHDYSTHPASERSNCQHCLQIFHEDVRHPRAPGDERAVLQLGQCIQYQSGNRFVWGHIGDMRWNSYTKTVWIHPVEQPNLVLVEDDILDWRPVHADANHDRKAT